MIEFDCPECGEPMEIRDRMAGEQIRCVGCRAWIEVPRRRRAARRLLEDNGLTGGEWALFAVMFALIPVVNVVVSSVLYYVWRNTQPRRANQINLLGFLIFGFHILVGILIAVLRSRN